VNFATRWFYQHLAGQQVVWGNAICALCGLSAREDVMSPKTRVFRPTFVDYDLQRRPDQPGLCPACVWYLGHQELLRSHWYLSASEARPLAKADLLPLLAEHLAHPPAEDRYYLVAYTKKKHVALRGRLNAAGARRLRVNAEVYLVDIGDEFLRLVDDLSALRQYHAWEEIESDKYLPYAILRWPSLAEFERRRAAVAPYLRSPTYWLARYLYTPPERTGKEEQDELGLPE